MGMDVHGINPNALKGRCFRRHIFRWPPLWQYCCDVSKEAREVENEYSNDGDGLDEAKALVLAATLRAHLATGHTAAYCEGRDSALAELPDEQPPRCINK